MDFNGRHVLVDFGTDQRVTLSDPALGTTGRWVRRERNAIQIDTPQVVIAATLTTDRLAMNATIYWPGGLKQIDSTATLRRVR